MAGTRRPHAAAGMNAVLCPLVDLHYANLAVADPPAVDRTERTEEGQGLGRRAVLAVLAVLFLLAAARGVVATGKQDSSACGSTTSATTPAGAGCDQFNLKTDGVYRPVR